MIMLLNSADAIHGQCQVVRLHRYDSNVITPRAITVLSNNFTIAAASRLRLLLPTHYVLIPNRFESGGNKCGAIALDQN